MVEDKWGVNQRLVFMYDENGAPNTVYYYNGSTSATKYYYVLNLQGDVTEIRSTSNALVAQYNYDAFGNILSIKDANGNNITSSTHIANVNPLRYRGYFYDPETGFYYLNSRYYDPATRRFISADMGFDEGASFTGFNLYAYCANNPVMYIDPEGEKLRWPGEIHRLVQLDILKHNSNMEMEVPVRFGLSFWDKRGRIDLLNTQTGEIWEVKPMSTPHNKAAAQLAGYMRANLEYPYQGIVQQIGGKIPTRSFTEGEYYIEYWYDGDGIIRYRYEEQQRVEEPSTSPSFEISPEVIGGAILTGIIAIIWILSGGTTPAPQLA